MVDEPKSYVSEEGAAAIKSNLTVLVGGRADPGPLAPGAFRAIMPPPRDWGYYKLLLFRTVSALAAPPGTGKTTLSIWLAMCFALHRDFGPYKPARTGAAWIWNTEDELEECERRIFGLCELMEIEPQALTRNNLFLNLNEEKTSPLIIAREDENGVVVATPHKARIIEAIRANGIALLIVDPFAETFEVRNENSNDAMKKVAGIWREIAQEANCCIFLVAHPPKSANSENSAGEQSAFRGGGAITGVARAVYTLFEMSKEDAEAQDVVADERHRFVRWDDAKANMWLKTGEAVWWEKIGVGIGNETPGSPEDIVGALRWKDFPKQAERSREVDEGRVKRLCAELIRICEKLGHTTPETATALKNIADAIDPDKAGLKGRSATNLIIDQIAPDHIFDGRRIVVLSSARGSLTRRDIYVETISTAGAE